MSTGGRMGRTKTLALGLALMMLPAAAFAQEAAPAAPAPAEAVAADAGASAPAPAVVELKPTQGIGMPVPEAIELQEQFTDVGNYGRWMHDRSEEHTSELQSLMRISSAVFCLKKKTSILNEH